MATQVRVNHKEFVELVRRLIEQGSREPLQEAARQTGVHPGTAGRICRQAKLSVKAQAMTKSGLLKIVHAILSAKPGTSLERIGKSLTPPISRQRVSQVREGMAAAGFKENQVLTLFPTN